MVILFSTHCPKCQVLQKKLERKGIEYTEETDTKKMLSMGIASVPWLKVGNSMLNFEEANKWINEQ